MERIDYPLLYFNFRTNLVMGVLVGPYWEVIQSDLPKMKTLLKDKLNRDYKKIGYYPELDMTEPQLKIFEIPIKPMYQHEMARYPLSQTLIIPIPVIHGAIVHGGYECYIPFLKQGIRYLEPEQFKPVVTSYLQNQLGQFSSEKLYQLMRYPVPNLEIISLKVKEKELDWNSWFVNYRIPNLERLATQVDKKMKTNELVALPDVAWERENEVADLIEKLFLANANVLVVGLSGAGKSAVIHQAIKQITLKSKGQPIQLTFWHIIPQRITASTRYLGDWQQNVEAMVQELTVVNGILWVDQIIQLLMQGGEGPEDSIASLLIPFLQANKIRLLGEVTPQELESMRRLLPGFVEYFQLIHIEPLSEKKNQIILSKFAEFAQKKLGVSIENNALQQNYRLLQRYYPHEALPGKSIKFLSSCIHSMRQAKKSTLRAADVIEQFILQSGLPAIFLRDDIKLNVEAVNAYFQKQIIGQNSAVNILTDIIKIYKAGLNDPNKPIATLLFAGPTGVGKTSAAKALAQYFFGQGQKRNPLIQIDMSEFQHPYQIMRFIGAGKEVGALVKNIREQPFSVLLLDEIEKANPAIFDALLTILDEGFLIDHYGRLTSFRNTIIIMTTNLGASNQNALGFTTTTTQAIQYESAIKKFFRPEFINRIDHIVQFNALHRQDVEKILQKELEELKQREGYEKKNLKLNFSDKLIQHIATIGFNPKYGARPLQRAIEHTITNPMAKWMLTYHQIVNQTLWLDWENELIVKQQK